MPATYNFPVVIGAQGAIPTPPATLLQQLIVAVAATNPGYTANLPASLIEDVSSTCVGALALIDQARVDLINSLTPYGANEFLLNQLGQIYGETLGSVTNTSVAVTFTGTVGYVIPNGFLVGDSTYTYQVQGGGVITNTGSSSPIVAIAIQQGSWGVAANTVTSLLTSYPVNVTLAVTNTAAGTPGSNGETYDQFRARLMQSGIAASVGTARFIKTLVGEYPANVAGNLIAVQQASGIRVIVGGSYNSYNVAYAIFTAIADPSALVGSGINSGRNVTVSLYDYPNTYSIEFVNAPVQTVTLTITWNTILSNFTNGGGFASLVQQPLVNYINGLAIGQPINVFQMNNIFQNAVSGLLDPANLTRLVFAVYINTTLTAPNSGTGEVVGDAESYWTMVPSGVTVAQG